MLELTDSIKLSSAERRSLEKEAGLEEEAEREAVGLIVLIDITLHTSDSGVNDGTMGGYSSDLPAVHGMVSPDLPA